MTNSPRNLNKPVAPALWPSSVQRFSQSHPNYLYNRKIWPPRKISPFTLGKVFGKCFAHTRYMTSPGLDTEHPTLILPVLPVLKSPQVRIHTIITHLSFTHLPLCIESPAIRFGQVCIWLKNKGKIRKIEKDYVLVMMLDSISSIWYYFMKFSNHYPLGGFFFFKNLLVSKPYASLLYYYYDAYDFYDWNRLGF